MPRQPHGDCNRSRIRGRCRASSEVSLGIRSPNPGAVSTKSAKVQPLPRQAESKDQRARTFGFDTRKIPQTPPEVCWQTIWISLPDVWWSFVAGLQLWKKQFPFAGLVQ
jgi:hypothetical protein